MSTRVKFLLYITLAVVVSMIVLPWIKNFLEVDKCLDKGSRWSYETNKCEEN